MPDLTTPIPPPVPSSLDIVDPGYAPPKAAPAPEPPGISPELLTRAATFGIAEADLRALPADVAERLLNSVEKSLPLRQPQAAPVAQSARRAPDVPAEPELKFNLDPALHEPEVVDAIQRLHQHYGKRLEDMNETLATVMEYIDSNQKAQANADLDRVVAENGDALEEVLGRSASNAGNRQAVLDAVDDLRQGYQRRQQAPPEDRQLFQRAVLALYSDRMTLGARSRLSEQLDQRAKTHIARPSGKGPADLSPRERAVRAVAEKMAAASVDAGQALPL